MIGAIESANKSKSGKTLSVKVCGNYYSSKNWELESMVGKEVTFEPSPQNFPDGTSIQWLNEYSVSGAQPTPAAAAMDKAVAVAASAGNRSHADEKGCEIGAYALCKSCPASNPDQAWENFQFFYFKLKSWDRIPF